MLDEICERADAEKATESLPVCKRENLESLSVFIDATQTPAKREHMPAEQKSKPAARSVQRKEQRTIGKMHATAYNPVLRYPRSKARKNSSQQAKPDLISETKRNSIRSQMSYHSKGEIKTPRKRFL